MPLTTHGLDVEDALNKLKRLCRKRIRSLGELVQQRRRLERRILTSYLPHGEYPGGEADGMLPLGLTAGSRLDGGGP